MESADFARFAARATARIPIDEETGEPCPAYGRVRVGTSERRAPVVASRMDVTDPGALAEQYRAVCADQEGGGRAYCEVLIRGETHALDTLTVLLEDGDDSVPETAGTTADKAMGWVIVEQARSLVRTVEDSNRRADRAQELADRRLEKAAEHMIEIERIRAEQGGGAGELVEALAPYTPLALTIAAKMAGVGVPQLPAPQPVAEIEEQGEEEGEALDPAAMAEELRAILGELDEADREAVLKALIRTEPGESTEEADNGPA